MIHSGTGTAESPKAYYFFHIPKTAGTTMYSLLDRLFEHQQICPAGLWHELLAQDPKQLEKYQLFRGHFYSYLDVLVSKPLHNFVFLRSPIERALSHYGHVLRAENHYLHEKAIALSSFEKFLLDSECRAVVSNFQARSLVQKFDPVQLARKFSEKEIEQLAIERFIETTPIELSDMDLLAESKNALKSFDCVGITEKFDASLKILLETFAWTLPDKLIENQNTNPNSPTIDLISDREKNLIERLNRVDLELYDFACNLLNQQD